MFTVSHFVPYKGREGNLFVEKALTIVISALKRGQYHSYLILTYDSINVLLCSTINKLGNNF